MINGKIEYLQLLQEPISRMSTVTAIYKGFSAAIVAGISTISYADTKTWIIGLSFLPIFAFSVLDIYYLMLERKYRFLYDQVRLNKHEIDFSMQLPHTSSEIKKAKARVCDCIKSPSILLFYPLLMMVLLIVFVFKCKNVI